MSKESYAERIKDAEVMSAGLQNNLSRAQTRGLDSGFISNLRNSLQDAINLNNDQEKLKADLKRKTSELDKKMSELNVQVSEARKIVKVEFSKEQWKEFGIQAKR